jgi:hypothetical protein
MSVPSETNLVSALSNGTQKVYPYTFRVMSADNLQVIVQSKAGVEQTKVLGTDYTVDGVGSYTGGSITLATAPLNGERVTIRRVIPTFTQSVDLRNQGAFFAETHEDVFDQLTMMLQQLKTDVARSAKLNLSSAASGLNVEFPKPKGNRAIGWNDEANALVNLEVGALYDGKTIQGGFYDNTGAPVPEEEAIVITAGTYP